MAKISRNPFKITRNDVFGRYLVASKDIDAGEIIFTEEPIMLGPKRFSNPICLGCHHSVNGSHFCSKCGFPMCTPTCQNLPIHAENECKIFSKKGSKPKKLPDYNSPQPLYQCILPLRLLMCRENDPVKWEKLDKMEHHSKLRKIASEDDWNMTQVNIVGFLRNWCGMGRDFDEETIHRMIGIIDVNCFQVKTADQIEVCGVYELGSIPCQDCVPNTHHAFTEDSKLIFRSSLPISKDQLITMSYAPLLIGTLDRRQFLRTTKYFDCVCNRCQDPTELGTFISGVKCLHCRTGYLLPDDPLQGNALWVCYNEVDGEKNTQCKNSLSVDKIQSSIEEIRIAINAVTTGNENKCTTEDLEKLLETYSSKFLHPNHFLLIPVWKELNRLYESEPDENRQRRKEIVNQLLNVLDKLNPGFTRSRGVLLYQKYWSQYESAKSQLALNKITQEEFDLEKAKVGDGLKVTKQIFELDKIIGIPSSKNFTVT